MHQGVAGLDLPFPLQGPGEELEGAGGLEADAFDLVVVHMRVSGRRRVHTYMYVCMYTCTHHMHAPCVLSVYIYRPSEQHHVGEGERRVGLPDRAAVERPEAQAHVEREAGVVWVCCDGEGG